MDKLDLFSLPLTSGRWQLSTSLAGSEQHNSHPYQLLPCGMHATQSNNTVTQHKVISILQWSIIPSRCLIKRYSTESTVAHDYLHSQIPWTDIGRYFGMQSRNCCETFFEASRNLHVRQNQKGETKAAGLFIGDPPTLARACSCKDKHYRTQYTLLCHMANVATNLKPKQRLWNIRSCQM